jgi:hypothetical protein
MVKVTVRRGWRGKADYFYWGSDNADEGRWAIVELIEREGFTFGTKRTNAQIVRVETFPAGE